MPHNSIIIVKDIGIVSLCKIWSLFRMLPREVDPLVYNMSHEDPGNISYSQIGGLGEQIRELREVSLYSYFLEFIILKLLPSLIETVDQTVLLTL